MAIIIILIAVSLSIALLFFWSLKSGQYDDTYTPSVRMLFDNKPATKNETKHTSDK